MLKDVMFFKVGGRYGFSGVLFVGNRLGFTKFGLSRNVLLILP